MGYKKAYGKINWILKVLPLQKGEKKHQIDSVMQLWSKTYDLIRIKKSYEFKVNYLMNGKQPIQFDNCSITKIINWLQNNFPNTNTNYNITVKKFIPVGSGLGGESTDAAYVLNYILEQNNLKLSKEQLKDIALNVGSDIPFFLSKYKTAHVNDYGNRVIQIPNINLPVALYPLNIPSDTAKVYQQLNKNKKYQSQILDVKNIYTQLASETVNHEVAFNDLQPYVFRLYPQIEQEYWQLSNNPKVKVIVNGAGSYLLIIKN